MKTGDVADGKIIQHAGRRHDKEIDAHRIPVELPQTGYHRLDPVAGDIVGQAIAQLEIQRLGQAPLHRKLCRLRSAMPAPTADGIAGRNHGRPRQIELPIDETLGAIISIALRPDRLIVDLDQTPAHHRLQLRRR